MLTFVRRVPYDKAKMIFAGFQWLLIGRSPLSHDVAYAVRCGYDPGHGALYELP